MKSPDTNVTEQYMLRSLVYLLLVALLLPTTSTEARHRDRLDTDNLDENAVEEIPIPVLFGVGYNDINPDYGDPRGGGTREHEGEDMLAPQGTPIVTPTEAIVTSTGRGDNAGRYVYTVNPGGERFRYMHLDEIADNLDRGDELAVGDFIGTVGDTGNAPDGVYHLHFETRDEDNDPQDPYDRLADSFDLEEKMSFLDGILRGVDDEDEYATFLVETFPEDFRQALQADVDVPEEIEDALAAAGVVAAVDAHTKLRAVLAGIPELITTELGNGDRGAAVALLQLYLLYNSSGAERDRLAAAGATGYYGPITEAAVLAYQDANMVQATGVYDAATRREMRS